MTEYSWVGTSMELSFTMVAFQVVNDFSQNNARLNIVKIDKKNIYKTRILALTIFCKVFCWSLFCVVFFNFDCQATCQHIF